MDISKKDLKEQEIRTKYITPALNQKGWQVPDNMREEKYFTDGRVVVVGSRGSFGDVVYSIRIISFHPQTDQSAESYRIT